MKVRTATTQKTRRQRKAIPVGNKKSKKWKEIKS